MTRTINAEALEFIRDRIWEADRKGADGIAEAIADSVRPATLEGIAVLLGWCHKCNGTGFVLADAVRECGDVPCGECQ